MNLVIFEGRLTKDVEMRYSQAQTPVAIANSSIAVNRDYKRPNEPDADFFDFSAFGKTAEFIEKYFKKGSPITLIGSMKNESWEKDGEKKYRTKLMVDKAHFPVGSKSSNEASADGAGEVPSQAQNQSGNVSQGQQDGFYAINQSLDDEDLPF